MINKKHAFTLAELMLVFTVIGILTAILIPALFAASPDQPKLKAKKGFNTVTRAVQTLMNTEPYAETGSLDAKLYITGDTDADKQMRNSFFCTNLANSLNSTNVDCSHDWVNNSWSEGSGGGWSNCNGGDGVNFSAPVDNVSINGSRSDRGALCSKINPYDGSYADGVKPIPSTSRIDYAELEERIDNACRRYYEKLTSSSDFNNQYNFKTPDGTLWGVQLVNYSHKWNWNVNGVKMPAFHGIVCYSTDGLKDVANMYGVGINANGKVHPGAKLQALLDEENE